MNLIYKWETGLSLNFLNQTLTHTCHDWCIQAKNEILHELLGAVILDFFSSSTSQKLQFFRTLAQLTWYLRNIWSVNVQYSNHATLMARTRLHFVLLYVSYVTCICLHLLLYQNVLWSAKFEKKIGKKHSHINSSIAKPVRDICTKCIFALVMGELDA